MSAALLVALLPASTVKAEHRPSHPSSDTGSESLVIIDEGAEAGSESLVIIDEGAEAGSESLVIIDEGAEAGSESLVIIDEEAEAGSESLVIIDEGADAEPMLDDGKKQPAGDAGAWATGAWTRYRLELNSRLLLDTLYYGWDGPAGTLGRHYKMADFFYLAYRSVW